MTSKVSGADNERLVRCFGNEANAIVLLDYFTQKKFSQCRVRHAAKDTKDETRKI